MTRATRRRTRRGESGGADPSARDRAELSHRLRAWYRTARRDLPWRRDPGAYRVWVSEIMLQQTRVATVVPYFERWMRRFPSVAALARADEDEVMSLWQGLGYYSRARSLREGARHVVERHEGRIPDGVTELLDLPGVGPYSAAAIASIAFGRRVPVVDGNVVRVLCRVFGLRGDPRTMPLKGRIGQLADDLVPAGAAGEHNQAMMELGATVCTPRAPACVACPLAARCVARRDGVVERLPELPARARPTALGMVAGLVWRRGRLLLARPTTRARWWNGLWQLPNGELGRGESGAAAAIRVVRDVASLELRTVTWRARERHSVTRFRIDLDAFEGSAPAGRARAKEGFVLAWKRPVELEQVGLPAPHRRLLRRLVTERG